MVAIRGAKKLWYRVSKAQRHAEATLYGINARGKKSEEFL